jgi:hypothetical protein
LGLLVVSIEKMGRRRRTGRREGMRERHEGGKAYA